MPPVLANEFDRIGKFTALKLLSELFTDLTGSLHIHPGLEGCLLKYELNLTLKRTALLLGAFFETLDNLLAQVTNKYLCHSISTSSQ